MTISIVSFFLMAHSFVLSIEPARIADLAIDDTFRVSVNVADVAFVYGYNISVTFDSLVLQAMQVTQGPFLSHFGNTIWLGSTVKPGKVENAAEACMSPNPGAMGSGTLFTIKFKVKTSGSSAINLYAPDIDISSPEAFPLPYLALLDSWYGTQSSDERGNLCISNGTNLQELPSATWIANILNYTVVWQDMRNGNYDIYGQKVDPDGSLPGSNYSICDSSGGQSEPVLAYNPIPWMGYTFALVVWTDYRRDVDSADIYGRLLQDGTPISSAASPIAAYPGFQNNPAIANCGSRYLAVWQNIVDQRDSSAICGQLLTNLGAAIGDSFRVSESYAGVGYYYNLSPAIATSDSAFLITWSHCRGEGMSNDRYLQGRIIDTLSNQGSVIDITSTISDEYYQPSCAYGNSNYLVVWVKWGAPGSRLKEIKGQLISKTGTMIGSNFTIYQTSDDFVQSAEVNFDGTSYLVVWDEKIDNGIDCIKGCFVSTGGSVGSPFVLCSAPYQQAFPSGAQGSSSIVIWQDLRNGDDYDIWGHLGPPVTIKEISSNNMSATFQVLPNPARDQVHFYLQSQEGTANLAIYDASGRMVKQFDHLSTPDGNSPSKKLSWNGIDNQGRHVENGVYFAKCGMQTNKFVFIE